MTGPPSSATRALRTTTWRRFRTLVAVLAIVVCADIDTRPALAQSASESPLASGPAHTPVAPGPSTARPAPAAGHSRDNDVPRVVARPAPVAIPSRSGASHSPPTPAPRAAPAVPPNASPNTNRSQPAAQTASPAPEVTTASVTSDSAVSPALAPQPVTIAADWMQEWRHADEDVGLCRGSCRITQGQTRYEADKMVLWVRRGESGAERLYAYLEDRVTVTDDELTRHESTMLVDLSATAGITLDPQCQRTNANGHEDPLYQRAAARRASGRRSAIQLTQLTVAQSLEGPDTGSNIQAIPLQTGGRLRRYRVFPRSPAQPFNVSSFVDESVTPREQVVVITDGVNLLIDGLELNNSDLGTVDLAADRAIVWTPALGEEFSTEFVLTEDTPYTVYLEGNVVVRQGDNVVRAERAVYDVREKRALVLNAELKSYLPMLGTSVRVRSERLRQIGPQNFHAQNAWVSTSQYGRPGYRIEASDVYVEQRSYGWFNQSRDQIDPTTGLATPNDVTWITALNSTLFIDEVPLLTVPEVSVAAEDPQIPLQSISFGQDRVFGTQVRTRFDAFQVFGIDARNRPPGVDWSVGADYLSDRGPALNTSGRYQGVDDYGNRYFGTGLAEYVHDDGDDNLGLGRRSLIPEYNNRGRTRLQHRHFFTNGMLLQGELGYVSDRNYLEQYDETEFDRGKDQETLLQLSQTIGNSSWSILGRPQVNPFENNTQWLPRGDLYTLGQSLPLGLVWSQHSYAGYGTVDQANPPTDPQDIFQPLEYYQDSDGGVAMTRQQLELPFNLGPGKLSPYALGEAAYWGDSLTGDSLDRFYGRLGLRGSLMMWRIFPHVQSQLFNLNGLAHKMVFDFDYSFSDSSQSLANISQWNEFEDDAQERFRERFVINEFGGTLPVQFDPRFYAVRTGAGSHVSDPYHELVDDQQVLRLGWNHRLQTHVGPPERQRIKDWMTFDLGVSVFPDADRDNFGETIGLLTSRYAWAVGDRTTILANAQYDFYEEAPQLWNVGFITQRGPRGSLYMGVSQVRGGPIDSQILTASYSYQMSPKWISTASTAYDIAENMNRGQSLTITRVGADFLFHLGANYDASKNNFGLGISVEPRFVRGNRGAVPNMLGPMTGTN